MSSISRVDQAVLQLRMQLQRLARERTKGTSAPPSITARPLQRLREIGENAANEDEYRRNFVRALLTEELGESLGNEPAFEAIANDVWRLLDDDAETRALMDEAVRQLNADGR